MSSIDGFPIDVVTRYSPKLSSKATNHPQEKGSQFTDSIIPDPFTFTMEGVISNTPSGPIASDPTRQGTDPAKDARDHFTELHAARNPVTVVTPGGTFTNCAMIGFDAPQDAASGGALIFTATFQQLTIIINTRTTVRVAVANGGGQDHKGDRQSITLDPSSTWVISYPSTEYNRAQYSKVYGPPIVKGTLIKGSTFVSTPASRQDFKNFDRYKVDPNKVTPDGFVDKTGLYTPYQFDPKDGVYRSPGPFYNKNPNSADDGISDYKLGRLLNGQDTGTDGVGNKLVPGSSTGSKLLGAK